MTSPTNQPANLATPDTAAPTLPWWERLWRQPACRQAAWRIAALAILGLLSIVALFAVPNIDWGPWLPTYARFSDGCHIPFFIVVTLLMYVLCPFWRSRWALRLGSIAGLNLGLAALVEIIQPSFGRSRSFDDWVNGALGIGLAVILVLALRPRAAKASPAPWRRPAFALAVCVSLVTVAWGYQPAWAAVQIVRYQRAAFPVLGDFESTAELRLWWGQGGGAPGPYLLTRDHDHAVHGDYALRVPAADGNWPGVYYLAGDLDWRAYDSIVFEFDNPGDPFDLALRLDDHDVRHLEFAKGARFNATLHIASGRSTVRQSLAEVMASPGAANFDLGAVRRLVLFRGLREKLPTFYIDHVRLEKTLQTH